MDMNEIKNSKLLIILLFSSLVIISLAAFWLTRSYLPNSDKMMPTNKSASISNEAEIANKQGKKAENEKNNQLYGQAIMEKRVEPCLGMIGTNPKQACIKNLAVDLADPGICINIADATARTDCKDYANYYKNKRSGSVSTCLEIASEYLKASCLQEMFSVVSTSSPCQQVGGEDQAVCELHYLNWRAAYGKDRKYCEMINDSSRRSLCLKGYSAQ